jgi:outer membrane protein assembly factor BamB
MTITSRFNIRMPRYPLALLIVSLSAATTLARADDYPQWFGPQRDGIHREQNILAAFPKDGAKIHWRAPVAAGYSQPVVAGNKVIVTDHILKQGVALPSDPFKRGQLPGVERVLCFDDASGKLLWQVEYDCAYTVSYAAGPRATPVIDNSRVYTLGTEGHVYCIDIESGKIVWNKKLEGQPAIWGYAAAPLVDGDRLILLSSGHPVLTALDKTTGEVVWTALEAAKERGPGYSPPMIHTLGGQRQLIQWYPEALVSLDPATGKTLWSFPYGPAKQGVSITTPLLINGDTFILTTQYEGCAAIQVKENQPKLLWHAASKGRAVSTLHALHTQMIFHDGHIFGINNLGQLLCIDPADGHVVWSNNQPTLGDADPVAWTAAFITPWQPDPTRPAKHFFIANEKGDAIICNLSPKGYTELSRTHLLDPTNTDAHRPVIWCHPAYAHQSIYWRNDKELIRASLAAAAVP